MEAQVTFELIGDYVSVGVGEVDNADGYTETAGTMIGMEQFVNAAKMLHQELLNQNDRKRAEPERGKDKVDNPRKAAANQKEGNQ